MKFILEINCDNAAFGPDYDARNEEVARILHATAKQLAEGYTYIYLTDYNGNTVGTCKFIGEES